MAIRIYKCWHEMDIVLPGNFRVKEMNATFSGKLHGRFYVVIYTSHIWDSCPKPKHFVKLSKGLYGYRVIFE